MAATRAGDAAVSAAARTRPPRSAARTRLDALAAGPRGGGAGNPPEPPPFLPAPPRAPTPPPSPFRPPKTAAAPARDAAAAAASPPPPAKRLKTLGQPLRPGAVRASLLEPESAAELRRQHDSSGPYTHVVLKDLAEPALLRAVREEVINNVQATYKETDLFKVFQTGGARRPRESGPCVWYIGV
jgi:hypothetical protein